MEAHLIPRDDLIQHTVSEDCVCGPDALLVPEDEPPWNPFVAVEGDRWLYRHHPLDGRRVPPKSARPT